MKDTPEHILDLQTHLFLQKDPQERMRIGFQMIDDVVKIIQQNIKNQHPEYSEKELKVAFFERFYPNDFSEKEKENIIEHLKKV